MPERLHAYPRDIPNAELHLSDGGHWLLVDHLDKFTTLKNLFLDRLDIG